VEWRAITNKERNRESSVIMSSVMPSEKELLLSIARHVAERQYYYGGPVGLRQRLLLACDGRILGSVKLRGVDAHRPGNVLQMLLAKIVDGNIDPAGDVLEDRPRQAQSTRLGDLLKARRDIHAIAVDVAVFDDDITEVNSYAEPQRRLPARTCHAALPGERAVDGIDDALELDQKAIAHELNHPAPVESDQGFDHVLAQACKKIERSDCLLLMLWTAPPPARKRH
jgi:hypothetical protein